MSSVWSSLRTKQEGAIVNLLACINGTLRMRLPKGARFHDVQLQEGPQPACSGDCYAIMHREPHRGGSHEGFPAGRYLCSKFRCMTAYPMPRDRCSPCRAGASVTCQ